ncbi:MAG: thioesterase family protein [Pseudomonadota bacterium]
MSRPPPPTRDAFSRAYTLQTRWADNDIYGHVNNAAYYGLIDTAVNTYLIEEAGLDPHQGSAVALVVETGCRYHAALRFPQTIDVGLKVTRLGRSSVTWQVALFAGPAAPGDPAAADAHFVHVCVDAKAHRPIPWPDGMRAALMRAQN